MVDIYLDASRLGIYPPLFTSLSGDSCILKADKKTIKNKIKRTINKKIGNLSIHIYVNSDLSSVFHFTMGVSLILLSTLRHLTPLVNRPFATKDHVVQNPPCWRASSLLFPHWDIKTKASQASLVQVSLS